MIVIVMVMMVMIVMVMVVSDHDMNDDVWFISCLVFEDHASKPTIETL